MSIEKVIAFVALIAIAAPAAITVSPDEMAQKNQWVQQNLLTASNLPPFSFIYHGVPSSTLLPSWVRVAEDTVLDTNRTQHVLTWTNAGINLLVKCVAVEYNDYPEVEWTVYLSNPGAVITPVVENIQGLDTRFSRLANDPEFVLNGNKGDFTTADSYEPWRITLGANSAASFAPPGSGKSSDGPSGWPYWNLQIPGGGSIIAVGWPGQWAASFSRDAGNGLRLQAGQQLTHLALQPGETIRTPLIALMFWQGTNTVRAQNLWRHWYMAHTIPRINGQAPAALAQIQVSGDDTSAVNSFLQAGIAVDLCWRDAGGSYSWYPSSTGPYTGDDAWLNTGTWDVDASKYPDEFTPFSDWVHAHGMKFLLWNEPERVGDTNSWLGKNHPEWLLKPGSVGLILNEGNPAAFNWLTNHFDGLIKAQGVDWYREDMNGGGPGPTWAANDPDLNRQGITENLYVQGHLAYWDALLKMNPGLRIDSCASGGRRNDLETMRRAVPLTRSDFEFPYMANVVDGNQCQTYGIASWLPFYGTGAYIYDTYSFRSFYMPLFGMGGLSPANTAAQQQAYSECRQIAPCMLFGDYYPLTAYSLADTAWMAWQFDRSDTGEGIVQAFRRTNSVTPSMTFQLQGLNPTNYYSVRDFEKGNLGWFNGSQLIAAGLTVQLGPRQSAVLYYKLATGVIVTASGNPSAGLPSLAVQLTATGISAAGNPLTYAWAFGDGETSKLQNPTHTYRVYGSYSATVTVSDGTGFSSAAQVPITVVRPQHSMKIGFSGYSLAETLTNFPALVVLGTNLAGNGFSYAQVASPKGWDLIFTALDGKALNYEIEKWNTNGNSYLWVQVPQLTSNSWIWAYWGDTNLTAVEPIASTNGSVWSNGYLGVWHLGETNGPAYDSSTNRTLALVNTNYGGCIQGVTGVIGNGCGFAGGYLNTGASTLPAGSNPRTLSAWLRKTAAATASPGKELLGYGNNSVNGDRFSFWISGNGTATALGVEDQGSARTFPWSWDSNWHHLVAVLPPGQNDLSGVKLYYDGTENTSAIGSGPIQTVQTELCFGAIPGYHTSDITYNLDGALDEVRVSSVARSPSWSQAEYKTMALNSIFSSYGTVIHFVPVSSVNLSISGNGTDFVISWPINAAAGSVLQESIDLLTWTNVPATVVSTGSGNVVTVMGQNAQRFYRLAN